MEFAEPLALFLALLAVPGCVPRPPEGARVRRPFDRGAWRRSGRRFGCGRPASFRCSECSPS